MSTSMSRAFSIGKEKRSEMTNSPGAKFVPGPGTHNPKNTYTMRGDPKWVFGTGKRPPL